MARRKKETDPAPELQVAGMAEQKRLDRYKTAEEKLREAEAEMQKAKNAFEEADRALTGIHADTAARDQALKRYETLESWVARYRMELAFYGGADLRGLCAQWDGRETPTEKLIAALDSMQPEAEQAAKALVSLMVRGRDAHAAANQAANESHELVNALADSGVKVFEDRPRVVLVQRFLALALRKALVEAGLSPVEHFVREALAPRNYTPPEAFAKTEAS